ncbi:membrane protein [Paenibacillus baekrokdamisoli]|uniref:Membrane protein n=1 Tax=Paenibacillus baekrokdamisoli TaxID=1712516 RepID=A0A3G9ITQ8_9BACL|nr:HupE/UreJ family protein [Paenibacillus baekrokdamisoli]MBB3067378.1 hydrogenase/urease accessory protein HupE [Paenibacillus baekrokdamisoli]BBH19435.1 membrane protein [Paenibacillus baekrokdamisoli]
MKNILPKLTASLIVLCLGMSFLLPAAAEAHSGTFIFTEVSSKEKVLSVTLRFDTLTALEIPGKIDTNGDGKLDARELEGSVTPVILPFVEKGLTVTNNGSKLPLHLARSSMPNPNIVKLELTYSAEEPIDETAIHYNLFFEKAPAHNNIGTLRLEDGSTQEFVLNASNKDWSYRFSGQAPSSWQTAKSFISLGVHHILTGYDHLLFLFALLLVAAKWRRILLLVSSFTIAHSITLILAATGVVVPISRLVEALIALTIVYVAIENVVAKRAVRFRALLTFVFGLVHGFGFAGILKEIGLPKGQEILSLLTFNIGIEAGQLAVVACLTPLLLYARKQTWGTVSQRYASLIIGVIGIYWFVTRII